MRDIEFYRLSDAVAKLSNVAAVLKQDMLMLLQLNAQTLKRLEALEHTPNENVERPNPSSAVENVTQEGKADS